jgi:hypothetical protein
MDQLLTFAVAVREGKYGLRSQVKVQSVEQALRQVAQGLVLDGYPDPRGASAAQQSLDLPISQLLKKFQDDDPKRSQSWLSPCQQSRRLSTTTDGIPTRKPWLISS